MARTTINPASSMAKVLTNLASEFEKVENVASGMFAILKDNGIATLEAFNALMEEAYKANQWQIGGGRPTGDTKPIPSVVRVYVSVLRSGYRHDLKVTDYTSISVLREDLRGARAESLGISGDAESNTPGVEVDDADALTGSVFHDLIVVYEALPAEDQTALEASVERLLKKYSKAVKLPYRPVATKAQPSAGARLH